MKLVMCLLNSIPIMSTVSLSGRASALLSALNQRGVRGALAKTLLRRHAQSDLARQIDYYDHEVVFRARLPLWAASPWLAHRIRRNLPPPADYLPASQSLAHQLKSIPYREPGHGDTNR